MTLYTVALLSTLFAQGLDQNDCALSSEHQLKVLRNVGSRYPGGKKGVKKREITWFSENGDKTVFGYGGCEDLGSVVSVTSKMKTPRSQRAVLSTALALGERFWTRELIGDSLALEVLKEGIQGNRLIKEESNSETRFNIRHEAYTEFYIEHTHKDGLDTVSVAWQGNW
jgi:hypothetical protein